MIARQREIELAFADLYVGLSGLDLGEKRLEFPRGIILEGTYAHLMAPLMMAFERPRAQGQHHPAPWVRAGGGFGSDITAQIHIPEAAAPNLGVRHQIAATIVFLLRLWADPAIMAPVVSNMPFPEIAKADPGVTQLMPMELLGRSFQLEQLDRSSIVDSLQWVAANFETTLKLMEQSAEFRFAANALGAGQFIQDTGLIVVSLWAALETMFSPSTAELKFRVSSLIASFLHRPGAKRQSEQKRIAALYDKRSHAAHGKPSHGTSDLLASFELLRAVLIQCIEEGHVPSKDELEARLFGARKRAIAKVQPKAASKRRPKPPTQ